MIRNLIPYELGGTVDYVLAPDGASCKLVIPAKWLSHRTQPSIDPLLACQAGRLGAGCCALPHVRGQSRFSCCPLRIGAWRRIAARSKSGAGYCALRRREAGSRIFRFREIPG